MSSVYDWSLIAADNANSDASINWAEGQPPSTVNNSARAMMQRVKELLNDLGGVATVSGTPNALTLVVSSGFTAYQDGIRLTFRVPSDNTASATLNVNGIGSKLIWRVGPAGVTNLSGGELQAGGIFEALYSEALDTGAGGWLLLNPAAESAAGFIKAYGGAVAPSGYLECDGAAVSRTTYAALFAAIGTVWGAGDGTTTFNVPNLENDFIRGASSTLNVGVKQAGSVEAHTHTITVNSGGAHTHGLNLQNFGSTGGSGGGSDDIGIGTGLTSASNGTHTHTATAANFGGTETRPRNGVVLFVIST